MKNRLKFEFYLVGASEEDWAKECHMLYDLCNEASEVISGLEKEVDELSDDVARIRHALYKLIAEIERPTMPRKKALNQAYEALLNDSEYS